MWHSGWGSETPRTTREPPEQSPATSTFHPPPPPHVHPETLLPAQIHPNRQMQCKDWTHSLPFWTHIHAHHHNKNGNFMHSCMKRTHWCLYVQNCAEYIRCGQYVWADTTHDARTSDKYNRNALKRGGILMQHDVTQRSQRAKCVCVCVYTWESTWLSKAIWWVCPQVVEAIIYFRKHWEEIFFLQCRCPSQCVWNGRCLMRKSRIIMKMMMAVGLVCLGGLSVLSYAAIASKSRQRWKHPVSFHTQRHPPQSSDGKGFSARLPFTDLANHKQSIGSGGLISVSLDQNKKVWLALRCSMFIHAHTGRHMHSAVCVCTWLRRFIWCFDDDLVLRKP